MSRMQSENGSSHKVPLLEAVRKHGINRLSRETGMSTATVNSAMYAKRIPSYATARKIAAALGLNLSDIAWPRGYRAEDIGYGRVGDVEIVDAPRPQAGRYYSGAEFNAAVEAEVERRIATLAKMTAQAE
jgi:DNA-binding phage protein